MEVLEASVCEGPPEEGGGGLKSIESLFVCSRLVLPLIALSERQRERERGREREGERERERERERDG
jgi:hypothetical protein